MSIQKNTDKPQDVKPFWARTIRTVNSYEYLNRSGRDVGFAYGGAGKKFNTIIFPRRGLIYPKGKRNITNHLRQNQVKTQWLRRDELHSSGPVDRDLHFSPSKWVVSEVSGFNVGISHTGERLGCVLVVQLLPNQMYNIHLDTQT